MHKGEGQHLIKWHFMTGENVDHAFKTLHAMHRSS